MSTIPEVLVAIHQGMKVLGFSIVTDLCFPEALSPVSIEEIIAVANTAEAKLARLVKEILARLGPQIS
jgi:purine-nucleoside phosphorylase